MNKANMPENEFDEILREAFKDDLPPAAQAAMGRHFLDLKVAVERAQHAAALGSGLRDLLRKEILAFAAAILLIVSGVIYLGGNQSVLADSIGRLKMVVTVATELRRAASMECVVRVADARCVPYCRVRWSGAGISRIDAEVSEGHAPRTLWIPDAGVSTALYASIEPKPTPILPHDALWSPALEFLSPSTLARSMETRYGLTRFVSRDETGRGAFLLVGEEARQLVEITVDATTYLPITIKKYPLDDGRDGSAQTAVEEVRFQWNQPVPRELLMPQPHGGNRAVSD